MIKKVLVFLTVMVLVLFSGCTQQDTPEEDVTVQQGDTVSINYTGRLGDDTVVMTSDIDLAKQEKLYVYGNIYRPLMFTVGVDENVYQGLHEGIIGMTLNETRIIKIPAEKGSGMPVEELFISLPISDVKTNFGGAIPEVGTQIALDSTALNKYTNLTMPDPFMKGKVLQVNETHLFVDFNYVYTGKTIFLETTVLSIQRDT